MFSVFQAESLAKKKSWPSSFGNDSSNNSEKQEYVYIQRKIVPENIVGTKFRTKTGCLRCRERRKKCDERYPICKACKRRGEKCEWAALRNVSKTNEKISKQARRTSNFSRSPIKESIEGKIQESNILNIVYKSNPSSKGNINAENKIGNSFIDFFQNERQSRQDEHDMHNDNIIPMSPYLQTVLNSPDLSPKLIPLDDSYSHFDDEDGNLDTIKNEMVPVQNYSSTSTLLILPYVPISISSLYLGEQGLLFLSYFEQKVCKMISVGLDDSNYLLKTFLSLAMTNESILNALASWGGLFLRRSYDNSEVGSYMNKAVSLVNQKFPNMRNLTKNDYFTLLSFNLISIGVHVCSGDVEKWANCFRNCKQLIYQYGGIFKLYNDFSYSNDIRFLLSNFQYHDIMSSSGFMKGTTIPIKEYEIAFDDTDLFFPTNYGIDPLQGCNQSLYLVLGDILNEKIIVKEKREELEKRMNSKLACDMSEIDMAELEMSRRDYLVYVDIVTRQLEQKIDTCQPYRTHSNMIRGDDTESKLHRTSFRLYGDVCRLYLNMYIKGMSPKSPKLQFILSRTLKFIDELIDSKMVVVLCLPLITASMASYSNLDRLGIERRFKKLFERCPVENVSKAWYIVQESWKRNPLGLYCVDWAEICDELGWELCVC